jgi:glutamate/tyrosine decarboxylase-like PLP-dependent enzyme
MEVQIVNRGADSMTTAADLIERIRRCEHEARPLEPGPRRRAELDAAVRGLAERYLTGGDAGGDPALAIPGYVDIEDPALGLLDLPIGEEGAPLNVVIDHLEADILLPGGHPASGGHLAYLTGGGLYEAALGDYLGAVSNKYPGVFFTGPGPVRMENLLVRWTADLVGYPDGAAGHIASGGSLANLTAVATARDAHDIGVAGGVAAADAVVYMTDQTHHCLDKALRLTGLRDVQVRRVPLDERLRMRPDALADAIAADRTAGRVPWLVVATAGTTDAGAVDPLVELASVAARASCWFHVDAAYGGFFRLTEHGREITAGIERSDSVVLDPHKSLFLPWGAGIVIVRDGARLATTHGGVGSYLQDAVRARGEISPSELSPELTKPFRALRMWLPLVLHGVGPFRAALDEKLLLARYFHREVAAREFETGPAPDLSVVTFRRAPAGMSPENADALNQAIVDEMRRDGRIFLSSTELAGRFTLRMAVLAHRTHLAHIDLALDLLEQTAAALEAGR